MTQLYRVLYCSRNCISGPPEAVSDKIRAILAASRRNNARDGITGGLLFSQGCFAQVLEGPLDAVETTFERIQCDEHHSDVAVLQSGPIEQRDFPDWSMAFTGAADQASPLAGIALPSVFSGSPGAGEQVLEMLRGVVVRETDWLSPVSTPSASAETV